MQSIVRHCFSLWAHQTEEEQHGSESTLIRILATVSRIASGHLEGDPENLQVSGCDSDLYGARFYILCYEAEISGN